MKTSMFRILTLSCLVLGIAGPLAARAENTRTTLNYLIGFPMDDTRDFIKDPSFIGFEADLGMNVIDKKNEASFVFGFQRFKKTLSNESFTDSNTGLTVTSDQERSISYLPLLVKWRNYPYEAEGVKWFVGAGAGGAYVERRFFAGSFDLSHYGWQFVIRPEAGASYMITPATAVEASLRYDYGFKNGDIPTLGILTLGLGFTTNY